MTARGETARRRMRAMWKTAVRLLVATQDAFMLAYAHSKDARGCLLNQSLSALLLKEVSVARNVLVSVSLHACDARGHVCDASVQDFHCVPCKCIARRSLPPRQPS
jgi:hypothetical protein